jgi:hypothetical protein
VRDLCLIRKDIAELMSESAQEPVAYQLNGPEALEIHAGALLA